MSTPVLGVLDTNAVVLLGRLNPDDLPAEPMITSVTLAELSVGPLVTDEPVERAIRQARVQAAENAFDPLPFDAVAIANDLPVYTCNPRDFGGISALPTCPFRIRTQLAD